MRIIYRLYVNGQGELLSSLIATVKDLLPMLDAGLQIPSVCVAARTDGKNQYEVSTLVVDIAEAESSSGEDDDAEESLCGARLCLNVAYNGTASAGASQRDTLAVLMSLFGVVAVIANDHSRMVAAAPGGRAWASASIQLSLCEQV